MAQISVFQAPEFSLLEWTLLIVLFGLAMVQMEPLADLVERSMARNRPVYMVFYYIGYVTQAGLSVSMTILLARESDWRGASWQAAMPMAALIAVSPTSMMFFKRASVTMWLWWLVFCMFATAALGLTFTILAGSVSSTSDAVPIGGIYTVWMCMMPIGPLVVICTGVENRASVEEQVRGSRYANEQVADTEMAELSSSDAQDRVPNEEQWRRFEQQQQQPQQYARPRPPSRQYRQSRHHRQPPPPPQQQPYYGQYQPQQHQTMS